MKQKTGHIIKTVEPGSIADQLGIAPGDNLLAIDDCEIEDVLDYRLRISAEHFVLLVEKPDGEQWEYDVENDYESMGLEFEEPLMSEYHSCHNRCIFCFIDQMPPGMRHTLYFKDDDARLSFLQGNYITMTNLSDRDVQRIIDYRLEPVNISVHTTNPELRCKMMNNRFAGDSLRYIKQLYDAGLTMNAQIVLCPGWNDGAELERSLRDLLAFAKGTDREGGIESLSVVPVGLTRYRENLTNLTPVNHEKALEILTLIEKYQKIALEKGAGHFVHASDEIYLTAGRAIPEETTYDGYPQLENGVGMLRLLIEEFRDAEKTDTREERKEALSHADITLVTGQLAGGFLKSLLAKYPWVKVREIRNDFFGESITVSGLVTGRDILSQLEGTDPGSRILLPRNMFRSGEEVLLDDVTRSELEEKLGVPVEIIGTSGYELYDAIR